VTRDIDPTAPLGARRGISTQVEVREHKNGTCSVLLVNTLDRPGLLTGERFDVWVRRLIAAFSVWRCAPGAGLRTARFGSAQPCRASLSRKDTGCLHPALERFLVASCAHASRPPALAPDIVRVLKDVNLNVVSAEVDTIGRNAMDKFMVTYHGEPLPGEARSCAWAACGTALRQTQLALCRPAAQGLAADSLHARLTAAATDALNGVRSGVRVIAWLSQVP
jgi:hypothetical protein